MKDFGWNACTDLGGHGIDTAPVVGGETCLLRGDVAGNSDLHGQLIIGEAADQCLLGDEVPAVGGLDSPVDIPRGQGNAVRPRVHVRRLGTVPVADRLAVVHGGEPLVGPGESRVVQVADELACSQIQGADGTVLGVFCDEGVAAGPEGVVDPDVIQLQLGEPLVFGVDVGPDDFAGGIVEVDYLRPVGHWHCAMQDRQ